MVSRFANFSPATEHVIPGARVHDAGVSYGVWAPDHASIAVHVRRVDGTQTRIELTPHEHGYFSGDDPAGRAGDWYGFELADGTVLPDPASRYQPDGVHGLSECIDPRGYVWRTVTWQRPRWDGLSIYELHVGTFTGAGTFLAAIERLDHLASLGVEAIELMPLADFPGQRNWGYDGVSLFAPARCYGRPDDLRAFVDAAHERGLAVILDVVYNHLGPDGNYLARFARGYFDPNRHTPWGQAFHLAGDESRPVRDFFISNAIYWLEEFRIDGLRLDATHAITDPSPKHILAEIAAAVHDRGGFVVAEDERNSCEVLRRPDGSGAQLDATWSDDFHHEVRVALTGVQDAYFKNYRGSPADLAETLRHGWFYTGQPFESWGGRPRGEPCAHLPPSAFVTCIENHDQVGNRARGERLEHLIGPAAFRAASALLCLSPYPPLLFMGQEWGATTPFLYFTDHHGELGALVSAGRQKEFSAAGFGSSFSGEQVPDPQAEQTFLASKLMWDELRLGPHATALALYRECLSHRRRWLKAAMDRSRWSVTAFDRAVAIRYRLPDGGERLVVSALQGNTRVQLTGNPVVQPSAGSGWKVEFESNARSTSADDPLATAATPVWTDERPGVETIRFGAPATVLLAAQKLERGDV